MTIILARTEVKNYESKETTVINLEWDKHSMYGVSVYPVKEDNPSGIVSETYTNRHHATIKTAQKIYTSQINKALKEIHGAV